MNKYQLFTNVPEECTDISLFKVYNYDGFNILYPNGKGSHYFIGLIDGNVKGYEFIHLDNENNLLIVKYVDNE